MAKVVHFEIQADDVDRAKSFYEKSFNWKIDKMEPGGDAQGNDYWLIETGSKSEAGINGGMYRRPVGKEGALFSFHCTIAVEDLDKAIAAIKQNGGVMRSDRMEIPGVGSFASAVDPEGNFFAVMQSTPGGLY
jgi:predicted enzyme related to lactoylglutathione lyase